MSTVTENTNYVRFDSLTAMEDFSNKRFFQSERASWVGRNLPDYDSAIKASREVWIDGINLSDEMYQKLKDAVTIELKDSKRHIVFSANDGDDVDYDRLMSGQQEFWRTSMRDDSDGPTTATICVHTTTSYNWSAEQAMWRGIAGVVAAEILEEAGHQVEIWAVGSNAFKTRSVDYCLLKSCSDPMDRSSLINALSTWYHRTVRFTALYTIDGKRDYLPISPLYPADLDMITKDHNRILISDVNTFNGAVELVKAEITRISESH
jgi:hypothetical protein